MESDLEQTVFDKLFCLLEPDMPSIEVAFRQCRRKLFKFFCWRRCEDPDNLADETISRLVKNVRAGQEISADSPYSYVYAIACNVFREYLRGKKRAQRLKDSTAFGEIVVEANEHDCKKQCLAQLSFEKLELLERYYLDNEDREAIAVEQQLSLNALRLKIHRIKLGLRLCWEDCQKHSDSMRN